MKTASRAIVLAAGLMGVSCGSLKKNTASTDGANPYGADNGGYNSGNFYNGDPANPATYAKYTGGSSGDRATVIPFKDDAGSDSQGADGIGSSPPRKSSAPQTVAVKKSVPAPVVASHAAHPSKTKVTMVTATPEPRKPAKTAAATGAGTGKAQKVVYHPKGEGVTTSAHKKAVASHSKAKMYVVKSGDTLTRVSRMSGVPVATIKKKNHLTSDKLRVGEQLLIN